MRRAVLECDRCGSTIQRSDPLGWYQLNLPAEIVEPATPGRPPPIFADEKAAAARRVAFDVCPPCVVKLRAFLANMVGSAVLANIAAAQRAGHVDCPECGCDDCRRTT